MKIKVLPYYDTVPVPAEGRFSRSRIPDGYPCDELVYYDNTGIIWFRKTRGGTSFLTKCVTALAVTIHVML